MKRILMIILAAVAVAGTASGQTLEDFKSRLAYPDSRSGARVTVTEKGDAAAIIRSMSGFSSPDRKVQGYRVKIFFDNSPNARQGANSVIEQFRNIYPEIPSYMNYDSPYFSVTVGNFLTEEEAKILWGRVRGTFDKAVVMKDMIPLSAFGK